MLFQRVFILIFSGLLISCSPIGSSSGGQTSQASFEYGCVPATQQKARSSFSPTIKKWNFPSSVNNETGVPSKLELIKVSADQKVMLALNNHCYQNQGFTRAFQQILDNSDWQPKQRMLGERSYYSFALGRDYSYSELQSIIQNEDCILTFEEHKTLEQTAFPSEPLMFRQTFWSQISYPQSYDDYFNSITATVTVAVIDSGMDLDHDDLLATVWTNPGEVAGNGIDDDGNGYVDDVHGYHFESNMGDPDPPTQLSAYNIHGTAVAGLIGASENATGIIGVMPSHIKIMSLNVFGEQASSDIDDVAEAMEYAIANGARVVNMSLAGRSSSTVIQTALVNAVAAGVVVIVAAGNDGTEITTSNFYAPAGFAKDIDGVISVGATISDAGILAPYSNYNPTYVEIAAPGSATMTSNPTGIYSLDVDNSYGYYDGTSFSAPIVTGAATLAIAYLNSRGMSYTPADVENFLKTSSDQLQSLEGYIQGCRSLNMQNLYELLSSQ